MADDTHVRIPMPYHQKMKELVKITGNDIKEEYTEAVETHLRIKKGELLIEDTKIESFISQRLDKMEKHLASMLGRTGMDVNMNLMAMVMFLEQYFKSDRDKIMSTLRVEGARQFTKSIKEDKGNNKGV